MKLHQCFLVLQALSEGSPFSWIPSHVSPQARHQCHFSFFRSFFAILRARNQARPVGHTSLLKHSIHLTIVRYHHNPASPTLVVGYIVACMAFYERGFGVPSHQFLLSLLWSCGLELHTLTPLWILHMVAFVTLCEAYIRIEPHFNLWSYFFWARL
jgi:hypothetical protein